MNKIGFFVGILAIVLVGVWAMLGRGALPPGENACTAEAKICPDGTAVGRSGPNCEFAECPVPAVTSATTTLAIGEKASVNGITITVNGLAEDSRCPIDVQCIQAGTVRVRVGIDAYPGDLILKIGEPQVVKNSIVLLESVIPAQKNSKKTVQPGDYRFTFTFVPLVANEPGAGIP